MKPLLLLALFISALSLNAKPKIGIVSFEKIFEGYTRKAQIEAELQTQLESLQSSPRVTAVQELDAQLKELAKVVQNKTEKANIREQAGEEFNSLALEYQSLTRELDTYLNIEKKKASKKMLDSIDQVVAEMRAVISIVAKEHQVDFVLEVDGKSNSQIPTVIYIRDKTDLTQSVIAHLNKHAVPAEAHKAAN